MASDNMRSTAAQFFAEEDQAALESISTYDRVVKLLNEASLMQKDSKKIQNLKTVQELIIHKEPGLLDNFLDEMLAFQSDRSADVKKFVISFMEEACKRDPEMLGKVVGNLDIWLQAENVVLVKRVILSMSQIYRVALKWMMTAKTIEDVQRQTWNFVVQMKTKIAEMIESENDGIRTHAIKFLESIVITLSKKTSDSETPKPLPQVAVDIGEIPDKHTVLKLKKLEEEGKAAFEIMMKYHSSSHISSVNLMTCMGSMTTIAKQRPQYIKRVVNGFEMLHVNLPPTLSKSQVSSVRKNLKMQLLSLLKHPSSLEFHSPITTLLTDLGATQSEVMKAMPKDVRKRKAEDSTTATKKIKTDIPGSTPSRKADDDDDDYGMTPWQGLGSSSKAKVEPGEDQKQGAIDITAEDIIPRLNVQNVADLVLLSMVMLPDTPPAHFQATYTPIAAAGTQAQIKHLARLLATQLTSAGLGKGYAEVQKGITEKSEEPEEEDDEEAAGTSPKHTISVIGGAAEVPPSAPLVPPPSTAMAPPASVPSRKGMRTFKLSAVTRPIEKQNIDNMAVEAIRRILKAERGAQQGNASGARVKILISLVSQFGGMLKDELQDFIFADLRNRADLALAWIYQEYANYMGYNLSTASDKQSIASYDECLTRLLNGLLERPDQREGLFSRLILEAPCVTPNSIQILRKYCQDETRIYLGMTTLKELILKRPCMKLEFLDVLLDFTSHERVDVRNSAIRVTKTLHEIPELQGPIEKYAIYYLKFLLQPEPPGEIFTQGKMKLEPRDMWTEESIKLCLYLYLGLLPVNHFLIHELANVYTATNADIKRVILRVIETPVKGMGMDSPELLTLVESCPKGAETLVTRIIHILTETQAPSPDLVEKIRDLYHKRVSDVRFLIPVLIGLSKKEVIAALPKLIKLNPVVVKEVFNRLLGAHGQESYSSPLTPAELLIALHNLDTSRVDMKTVIKATNLCFAEKSIYTQEVLALVMQQLMDQSSLPTLLMRTVIQSLAMYPKLLGFVLNILQRLIVKQVWKQKKVWEGFIKCCQRTKPQSFQVLLQLPAPQLKSVFEGSPDLREPLYTHVQSFTPHQRAHIPKAIMTILEKDPAEEQKMVEKAKKEEEERLAAQEKLYQQKLEEERKKQQDLLKERIEQEKIQEVKTEIVEVPVKIEEEEDQSTQEEPMDSALSDTPVDSSQEVKTEQETPEEGEATESDDPKSTPPPKKKGRKTATASSTPATRRSTRSRKT